MNSRYRKLLLCCSAFAVVFFGVSLAICDLWGSRPVKTTIAERGVETKVHPGMLCSDRDNCEQAFFFQGGISKTSVATLTEALNLAQGVSWVCLDSPGGESDEGRELGRKLRGRNVGTCVVPRHQVGADDQPSECGSACSSAWLGGSKRVLAQNGAAVGFHASFIGDNWCCTVSNFAHRQVLQRLYTWKEGYALGNADARDALRDKGSSCGPNEFYFLRAEEARSLKLVLAEQSTPGWHWKPLDQTAKFTAQPRAFDCSQRRQARSIS